MEGIYLTSSNSLLISDISSFISSFFCTIRVVLWPDAYSADDIFNFGIRLRGFAYGIFVSCGFCGKGCWTGEVIRGFEFDFSLPFFCEMKLVFLLSFFARSRLRISWCSYTIDFFEFLC